MTDLMMPFYWTGSFAVLISIIRIKIEDNRLNLTPSAIVLGLIGFSLIALALVIYSRSLPTDF